MARLFAIIRRLRIVRKVDVVTVSSRHGHFLPELTIGLKTLSVDPTSFPLFLSIKFLLTFVRLRKSVSRVSRYVLATTRATKARVVLATDAVKELTEIANMGDKLEVIAVMHGFYIDQRGNNLREGWATQQTSAVTLCALGESDRSHYRRWGNSHKNIMTVGSANNCLYLRDRGALPDVKFDICIVQGALNPNASDEFSRIRLKNWERITDYVNRLAVANDLSVSVALNASSKEHVIREWFEDRIENATYFRSSVDRFATYQAIDSSRVSIGEASTSLIEGLARKNRCMAINFSGLDILSLPGPALASLTKSGFDDFEAKYCSLRDMSDEEFWDAIKDEVKFLIETDEQHLTIEKIRQHIDKFCS
jgi:hypothetical protein